MKNSVHPKDPPGWDCAKLLELNFFLTITDIAIASPTAKVKVVLEVGAKLRGQASLETFISI